MHTINTNATQSQTQRRRQESSNRVIPTLTLTAFGLTVAACSESTGRLFEPKALLSVVTDNVETTSTNVVTNAQSVAVQVQADPGSRFKLYGMKDGDQSKTVTAEGVIDRFGRLVLGSEEGLALDDGKWDLRGTIGGVDVGNLLILIDRQAPVVEKITIGDDTDLAGSSAQVLQNGFVFYATEEAASIVWTLKDSQGRVVVPSRTVSVAGDRRAVDSLPSTLQSLPDGDYTLGYVVSDALGNKKTGESTVTVGDNTSIALALQSESDTGVSAQDGHTNATVLKFDLIGQANRVVTITASLQGTDTVVVTQVTLDEQGRAILPVGNVATPLVEGVWQFRASIGGASSASVRVWIDRHVDRPTVTIADDQDLVGTVVELKGKGLDLKGEADAVVTYQLRDQSGNELLQGSLTLDENGRGKIDLSSMESFVANNAYKLRYDIRDRAGNVLENVEETIAVVALPSNLDTGSSNSDGVTAARRIELVVDGKEGDRIRVTGKSEGQPPVAQEVVIESTGTAKVIFEEGIEDGEWVFTATNLDDNREQPLVTVKVDTTAPTGADIFWGTLPAGTIVTSASVLKTDGIVFLNPKEPGARIDATISKNNEVVATGLQTTLDSNGRGVIVLSKDSPVDNGAVYTVRYTVRDVAGNVSDLLAAVVELRQNPVIVKVKNDDDGIISTNDATIAVSGTDDLRGLTLWVTNPNGQVRSLGEAFDLGSVLQLKELPLTDESGVLPQGKYKVDLKQGDEIVQSINVVVDRTPPHAPVVTIKNDDDLQGFVDAILSHGLAFKGEPNAKIVFTLEDSAGVVVARGEGLIVEGDTVVLPLPSSTNLLPEKVYMLRTTLTDQAGNSVQKNDLVNTLQGRQIDLTLRGDSDGIVNTNFVTVVVTTKAPESNLELWLGNADGAPQTRLGGSFNLPSSVASKVTVLGSNTQPLDEGTHHVLVLQNGKVVDTLDVVVDRTAPERPEASIAGRASLEAHAPVIETRGFELKGEPSAQVSYTLYDASTNAIVGSGSTTFNNEGLALLPLMEGVYLNSNYQYTLSTTLTDVAGNSAMYTHDVRTLPAAGVDLALVGGIGNLVKGPAIQFEATPGVERYGNVSVWVIPPMGDAFQLGDDVELQANGPALPLVLDTKDYPQLGDGEYTVELRRSGEILDSVSFTLDTTPPTVKVTIAGDNNLEGLPQLIKANGLTFVSEDGAMVSYALRNEQGVTVAQGQGVVGSSLKTTLQLDAQVNLMALTSYALEVTTTDVVGNEATTTSTLRTLDARLYTEESTTEVSGKGTLTLVATTGGEQSDLALVLTNENALEQKINLGDIFAINGMDEQHRYVFNPANLDLATGVYMVALVQGNVVLESLDIKVDATPPQRAEASIVGDTDLEGLASVILEKGILLTGEPAAKVQYTLKNAAGNAVLIGEGIFDHNGQNVVALEGRNLVLSAGEAYVLDTVTTDAAGYVVTHSQNLRTISTSVEIGNANGDFVRDEVISVCVITSGPQNDIEVWLRPLNGEAMRVGAPLNITEPEGQALVTLGTPQNPLMEGKYTLELRHSGSVLLTRSLVVDRTAPAEAMVTIAGDTDLMAPASTISSAGFEVKGEAGAEVTYEVLTLTGTAVTSGSGTLDDTGSTVLMLANGVTLTAGTSYTLRTTLTDAAGNTSTATDTLEVAAAPTTQVSVKGDTDGIVNGDDITISVTTTGELNVTLWLVSSDGTATQVGGGLTFESAGGTQDVSVSTGGSPLTEGSYTVEVRQGNLAIQNVMLVVDRTAPAEAMVTIAGDTDLMGLTSTISSAGFEVKGEARAEVTYEVLTLTGTAVTSGSGTLDDTGSTVLMLANGVTLTAGTSYTLRTTLTDAAGNTSTATDTLEVAAAPTTQVSVKGDTDGIVNGNDITISVTTTGELNVTLWLVSSDGTATQVGGGLTFESAGGTQDVSVSTGGSPLTEGSYTVEVRQGNLAIQNVMLVVDRTAPAEAMVTIAGDTDLMALASTISSAGFEVKGEAGAEVTYEVLTLTGTAVTSGSGTLDDTGSTVLMLANGVTLTAGTSYTLRTTLTDAAGNTSTATDTLEVAAAPTTQVSVKGDTDGIVNGDDITISVTTTGELNVTLWLVSSDGTATQVGGGLTFESAGGTQDVSVSTGGSPLTEGSYTVEVRQGNLAIQNVMLVVDRTAPAEAMVTIAGDTDLMALASTISSAGFEVKGEAGAEVTYEVLTLTGTAVTSGSGTLDDTGSTVLMLANGVTLTAGTSYTLRTTLTDAAGNTSTATDTLEVAAAPTTQVSVKGDTDGIVNGDDITISVTTTGELDVTLWLVSSDGTATQVGGGLTFESAGGTQDVSVSTGGSPLTEGSYTVEVRQGNLAIQNVMLVVDRTAPAEAMVTIAGDTDLMALASTISSAGFEVKGEAGAEVTYEVLTLTGTAVTSGSGTLDDTGSTVLMLANGVTLTAGTSYTLRTTLTDAAGNTSTATDTLEVAAAPTTQVSVKGDTDGIVNGDDITISVTTTGELDVTLWLVSSDGTATQVGGGLTFESAGGTQDVSVSTGGSPLTEGSYTVEVRQGNLAIQNVMLVVDRTAPTEAMVTIAGDTDLMGLASTISSAGFEVKGEARAEVTYEVLTLTGTAVTSGSGTLDDTGSTVLMLANGVTLTAGTSYTLRTTLTDAAGNTSTATDTLEVAAAPISITIDFTKDIDGDGTNDASGAAVNVQANGAIDGLSVWIKSASGETYTQVGSDFSLSAPDFKITTVLSSVANPRAAGGYVVEVRKGASVLGSGNLTVEDVNIPEPEVTIVNDNDLVNVARLIESRGFVIKMDAATDVGSDISYTLKKKDGTVVKTGAAVIGENGQGLLPVGTDVDIEVDTTYDLDITVTRVDSTSFSFTKTVEAKSFEVWRKVTTDPAEQYDVVIAVRSEAALTNLEVWISYEGGPSTQTGFVGLSLTGPNYRGDYRLSTPGNPGGYGSYVAEIRQNDQILGTTPYEVVNPRALAALDETAWNSFPSATESDSDSHLILGVASDHPDWTI